MNPKLTIGLLLAGGVAAAAYALRGESPLAPPGGAPLPSPEETRGGLPPSAAATTDGAFIVSLGVGAAGGKAAGVLRFPTPELARAYYDETLPLVREVYANEGGALALNGPALEAKLEVWDPAPGQTVPSPQRPMGPRPVIVWKKPPPAPAEPNKPVISSPFGEPMSVPDVKW